jgi:hypothetical protein
MAARLAASALWAPVGELRDEGEVLLMQVGQACFERGGARLEFPVTPRCTPEISAVWANVRSSPQTTLSRPYFRGSLDLRPANAGRG